MATIVTRAGKGAALTHNEVDANFTNLNTELAGKANTVHTHAIGDVTNLPETLDLKVDKTSSTGAAALPASTTANRPGAPVAGYIRYNTTTGKFEGYGSSWGNIGGGAAIGDTPPANPGAGDLWWNSADGRMYVYYTDANSSQWVDLSAGGAGQYLPLTGGTVSGNLSVTGNFTIGTNSTETGERLRVVTTTGNTALTVEANGVGPYIRLLDTLSSEWALGIPDGSSSFAIMSGRNAGSAGTERLRIDSSGNVGIGTSSPSLPLDVSSAFAPQIRLSRPGGIDLRLNAYYGNVDVASLTVASNHPLTFHTNNIERVRIHANPQVSVGTTNAALEGAAFRTKHGSSAVEHSFGTNGSGAFILYNTSGTGVFLGNGATSWTANSDERVKDIIEPITDAANKVSSLRAVIGKYKKDDDGVRRSFLIAQDVHAVLPEAVTIQEDDIGTMGVQYTDVIPLLVAAIKELKAEIDQLKGGE